MRVLVLGATGLIGAKICAGLFANGHTVVGAGRHAPRVKPPALDEWVSIDFARAGKEDWQGHLAGVDVVVNCVGVLQDSPREDTRTAHVDGPAILFAECVRAGVARIIHFSAIGVDRHQASAFSESKLRGDEALMALPANWVILRPSVVLGPAAFGASALFRGLAALPWLPAMRDTGDLQVVDLDDVVETVLFFLRPDAPSRLVVELAGPERLSMPEVVGHYRRWLGWPRARVLTLPDWASTALYRLGDMVSKLGWRPPVRSTARREIAYGAVGNPAPWTAITGIEPATLGQALARRPPSIQERWFARMYLLKPALFVVLSAFWMLTGIISLTTGFAIGTELMNQTGMAAFAASSVVAGAIADILVGLTIACRRTAFYGLWAAIGLSAFYLVAGTLLLPALWNEPLGPLLKIAPILAAHAAALAILEER